MFCSKCGNEIKDGEIFCSKCGCKIGNEKNNKKKTNRILKVVIPIIIIVIVCVALLNKQSNNEAIDRNTQQQTEISNTNNESVVAPIATIKIKDYGTIKLELYYNEAPNTVKNFIALANNGFYDNLTFHRLVKDFMIQGGDKNGDGTGNATLKDINKGGNKEYCIEGEFGANNVQNKVSLVKGVIAMARTDYSYMYEELTLEGYDSASSQFFIMTADHTELDNEYAGFGKVIEGIDLLDKLNNVAVDSTTEKPLKPVIIEQIRVDTNNKNYELPETLDVLDYENYVVTGQKTYKTDIIADTDTNVTEFKSTKDLKNFSKSIKLATGEEKNVNGLDIIFYTAMKEKFSEIKSGNGGTVYSQILTAIGPTDIKGFIIDENIIGGYVIYYHYDERNSYSPEGYYLYKKSFAIKVTNWDGLNNLLTNEYNEQDILNSIEISKNISGEGKLSIPKEMDPSLVRALMESGMPSLPQEINKIKNESIKLSKEMGWISEEYPYLETEK